jgi:putative hydrolase
LRLADLWLDDATDLPSGVVTIESWSRVDWIERTLPVWATLCDPIAARVVDAMGSALPEEVRAQAGPLGAVMNQFGGMMFGAQVGQGIGALAQEIVSSTDVGLPLAATGLAALLPQNVTAFGEGLERPQDEVRLYLALREAAHQRLYAHVGWLRQRVIDTIESYARGIRVDPSAIERAMSEIDPTNPESMQNALAGGMFEPDDTPEQAAALRRLEVLLALIEGWVDAVVQAAAGERMPGADALREASRRRRATGGPAEQTFSTLVGLQLRPRRLRDAAALWWAVTERRGVSGRDAIWAHPDLLPTAEDLDDPIGFAEPPDDSDPMTELRSEDADDPDANDPGSDDRGDGQRS